MKKVLYLSNVHWNWIKQRPHFVAEGLCKNYNVDLFFTGTSKDVLIKLGIKKLKSNYENLNIKTYIPIPFVRIPYIGKSSFFDKINNLFLSFTLPSFKDYDIIWVCSPMYNDVVQEKRMDNNIVVYDCMDDFGSFPTIMNDRKKLSFFLSSENDLINSADFVFCSSDYLSDVIRKRSRTNKSIHVVNNAIAVPDKSDKDINRLPAHLKDKYDKIDDLSDILMYVGTVADWFDYEVMVKILDTYPTFNLILIGPNESSIQFLHPRVHCLGPIPRDYIFSFMDKARALVMPFIVNELIKSVNPVKLYEYIYTGKPIFAPLYGESKKFSKFVNLYKDADHLISMVGDMVNGTLPNYTLIDAENFVESNTWDDRMVEFFNKIDIL